MNIILCNTWRSLNSNIVDYRDLQGKTYTGRYYTEDGYSTETVEGVPMSVPINIETDTKYFSGVPVLELNGDPLTIRFKIKFTFNVNDVIDTPSFAYNYVFSKDNHCGYFITNIIQKAPQVLEITAKRDVMSGNFRNMKIRLKTETLPDLSPTNSTYAITEYPINNIPITNTSSQALSKDLVNNIDYPWGRLYVVLSQNKTDVPDLQKLASQGDIADLLKNMSFSSLESFTDNFDGTKSSIRLLGENPTEINGLINQNMSAIVPGGYYFITGQYSMEKLLNLLRDDPHYANIVQDMWWSPLTFGGGDNAISLEGIGKESGITMYDIGAHQSTWGTFAIDVNLQEWFSQYSLQWAGQEIKWSPSDYGTSGKQIYYWQITLASSSSDTDKLKLYFSREDEHPHDYDSAIQIGVISVPVVKINPVTRSFTTSLQSSFYSILTGNTLGLLGYTASNIGKDNDNDDEDGGDKEKVNPIMKMLADIFSGIAGTLLFSGSVAPLKDAQNAVATGGGVGSNSYTNGNMVPTIVKSYPGSLGFAIANSAIHTPNGSPVKTVGEIYKFNQLEESKFYSGDLIGDEHLEAGVGEELNRILNNGIFVYDPTD